MWDWNVVSLANFFLHTLQYRLGGEKGCWLREGLAGRGEVPLGAPDLFDAGELAGELSFSLPDAKVNKLDSGGARIGFSAAKEENQVVSNKYEYALLLLVIADAGVENKAATYNTKLAGERATPAAIGWYHYSLLH